jgi:hypothetical protein
MTVTMDPLVACNQDPMPKHASGQQARRDFVRPLYDAGSHRVGAMNVGSSQRGKKLTPWSPAITNTKPGDREPHRSLKVSGQDVWLWFVQPKNPKLDSSEPRSRGPLQDPPGWLYHAELTRGSV